MRIAITADTHWGHGPRGDQATLELAQTLRAQPPDLLLLGGDIGTNEHFAECLQIFADLPCEKAFVPGNHDLWVLEDDARGDSLRVYQSHLPTVAREYGFRMLDEGPIILPEQKLAFVGSINWYDYSWSLAKLPLLADDWEARLLRKSFTRGKHNDGRFVRWTLDDIRFTQMVVRTLQDQLLSSLDQVDRAVVLTHHPAMKALNFPRDQEPTTWDGLLWDALSGNAKLETILHEHAARIPFVFSGHTHRQRDSQVGPIRAINVGGDYHFKRLITLLWPEGTIEEQTFGDPVK